MARWRFGRWTSSAAVLLGCLAGAGSQAATIELDVEFDLSTGTLRHMSTFDQFDVQSSGPTPFTLDDGDTLVVDFRFVNGKLRFLDNDPARESILINLLQTEPITDDFEFEWLGSVDLSGVMGEWLGPVPGRVACFACVALGSENTVGSGIDFTTTSFTFSGGRMSGTLSLIDGAGPQEFQDLRFQLFGAGLGVVPEPASGLLVAAGVVGLALARRRHGVHGTRRPAS